MDDDAPTIRVGDLSGEDIWVPEGQDAVFTVQLTGAAAGSQLTLTLDPSGSHPATEGADYKAATFQYSLDGGASWHDATEGTPFGVNAGDSQVLVKTDTFNDSVDEFDETFTLTGQLSSLGASYSDSAVATIVDDDVPVVSIAVAPPSVQEDGATNLVYQVSLDRVSVTDTVVTIALGGTATEGSDYGVTGLTGTHTVTIVAGQLSTSFVADPVGDSVDEVDETVVATITGATGASVSATANQATGTIVDDDELPLIEDAQSRVSEEGLPGGLPDASGSQLLPSNDSTDLATKDPAGTLDITRNGAAPLTVELINPGLSKVGETSLSWAYDGTNHAVLIGSDATSGEAVIRVTLNNGSIDVGSSGVAVPYSVELLRPIQHSKADLGAAGEDSASLSLTVRISDGVNSADEGTLTVTVEDDGPSIVVSASAPAAASLVVDESTLSINAINVSFASSFGNLPSYGADGAGTVSSAFALGIKSVGADSGLVDTATGNHIYLYMDSNDVVGRVGSATTTPDAFGAVAFRVSNSGASLTLDQVRAIVHPTTDPNEGQSLSGDDLLTLTRTDTITDKDGDTNTGANSINLGNAISFKDDGPSITSVVKADILTVDESTLPNIATANLVDNFSSSISYGADGAGTTAYALVLNGSNVGSGLYALGAGGAKGSEILLNQAGNVITGSVSGTDYFTISFDNSTGEVKFEQKAAVHHSDTTNFNDTSTLTTAAGALVLRATVTDADGDSATHNLDLTGAFKIIDAGPEQGINTNVYMPPVNLDETVGVDRYATPAEALTSQHPGNTDDGSGWLGRVETQFTGGFAGLFALSGSYGSDGPGSITYLPSFTGIPSDGLVTNLSSTAGGTITIFLEGGAIVGRDADGGSPVFTIEIVNTALSGDPVHQLRTTLYEAIRHGDTTLHDEPIALLLTTADEVYLTYRVVRKDGDGDTSRVVSEILLMDTSSSFLTFDDDGPVANTYDSGQAVDSAGYLLPVNGFGADGGHVESITLDGTTYTWNTSTNSIDVTGDVDRQSVPFNTTDHRLVVNFAAGGEQFAVDMDDGRYNLSFNHTGDVRVDVDYRLIDNDGDLASSTLPINLHVLLGEDANDNLSGSSSDEILIGGLGDDTLTGGLGADVFQWRLEDRVTSTPAVDHVADFTPADKDVLDLRDLLTGEHAIPGGTWNLDKYLNFGDEGGKLALLVDPDGAGPGGVTQKIVLDNFANQDALSLALTGSGGLHDADLIKKLVAQGNLKLDP